MNSDNAHCRPRIYLHIGLHKTGTSSFQNCIRKNQAAFLKQNLAWYQPMVDELNAHEIPVSVLREGVCPRPVWFRGAAEVGDQLQRFLEDNPGRDILVSAESLSFVRTDEECVRLRKLFGDRGADWDFIVLVVLREQKDWWGSYCNEIKKTPLGPSRDPQSYRCLDPSGWITDFEALLTVYRRHFSDVRTIAYSRIDIVPLLLAEMGRESPTGNVSVRLNKRDPIPRIRSWYKRNLAQTWVGRMWRKLKREVGCLGNLDPGDMNGRK